MLTVDLTPPVINISKKDNTGDWHWSIAIPVESENNLLISIPYKTEEAAIEGLKILIRRAERIIGDYDNNK